MKRTQLNICLVSPLPPPYGGIAHWTQMLLRHASAMGGVELVAINTAPTWRPIYANGIAVRALGGALQLLRDCVRIVRTLSGRKFDAIHVNTSGHLAVFRDLAVSFLARWFGVGLIYHIRFGRIPSLAGGRSLEWWLIRIVMRRSAKVILIDRATFESVRKAEPRAKVVLIPNCVDIDALPSAGMCQSSMKTALFLGWVLPTKGVGELVEAWRQLNLPGWQLDIVGPFDEAYRDALLDGRAPDNIQFLGQLSHEEAMARMATCDLFVLPSHTEGFPNVVVEAMALGRAIIATEVGAIPEMLADGAGELVKRKDVGALIQSLSRLMSDEKLRRCLADRALKRAKMLYTIDVVFKKYEDVWRSASDD